MEGHFQDGVNDCLAAWGVTMICLGKCSCMVCVCGMISMQDASGGSLGVTGQREYIVRENF